MIYTSISAPIDKEEWAYGLCPLEDYMKSLYNRTM